MNTKRVLAVILSLLMLLAFAGCSSKSDDYEAALALMEQSEWEAARAMLVELAGYEDSFTMMNECDYNLALDYMKNGDYESAACLFDNLANGLAEGSYKDTAELLAECRYTLALDSMKNGEYESAADMFKELAGDKYKDSADMLTECSYQMAVSLYNDGKYLDAAKLFSDLDGYKDAGRYVELCTEPADEPDCISNFAADMEAAFDKAGLPYSLKSGESNGDAKYYTLTGEGCSETTIVMFAPLTDDGLVAASGQINGIVVVAASGTPKNELCDTAGVILSVLCGSEEPAELTATVGDMLEKLPEEGTPGENSGVSVTSLFFDCEGYECRLTTNEAADTFTVKVPEFASADLN